MKRTHGMAVAWAAALAGCAGMPTQFTGAAKVENGPGGCRAACDAWGMDLAGMVKMGEYSDGCICQVRPGVNYPPAPPKPDAPVEPAQAPTSRSPEHTLEGAPSSGGQPAVTGVWLQMQAAAAAAAQQTAAQREMGTGVGPFSQPYVPGSPVGSPGWRPGLP